jgi:hypothetical protein
MRKYQSIVEDGTGQSDDCWMTVAMLVLLENMIKIEHKNVKIFQEINTMHLGIMVVKVQDTTAR